MQISEKQYRFISAQYLIDRKLYKYYSNVGHAVDCIKNRRIHLDDPRYFNDPFDAVIRCPNQSILDWDKSERDFADDLIDALSSVPADSQSQFHQDILKAVVDLYIHRGNELSADNAVQPSISLIKNMYSMLTFPVFSLSDFIEAVDNGFMEKQRVIRLDCRMSCFTEVCDSILMWSYYANSHQGVCIEYDLSKLDETNPINESILRNITKVHYSPLRADVQFSGARATGLNFISSKADVWEHEHEWRIICETQEEYLPFDCISKVYVGVNFNTKAPKYQDLVKAVNTHDALSIMQCKLSRDKYQIEFEEIYNSSLYNLYLRATKPGKSKKKEPSLT